MSMGAEVGLRAKAIAEAAAYRTEGSSSKGASGEKETASTGAHVTACKKAESNEDTTEEECGAVAERHTSEENPLVLLQVNCRSICNKIVEFWNLIDTYKPAVIIGT